MLDEKGILCNSVFNSMKFEQSRSLKYIDILAFEIIFSQWMQLSDLDGLQWFWISFFLSLSLLRLKH